MRFISLFILASLLSVVGIAKEPIPACEEPTDDFCMGTNIAEQSYFEKNIINVTFPATAEHFSVEEFMPPVKVITVKQEEPIFHHIFYPRHFAVFGHTFFTSSPDSIAAAEKKLKSGGTIDVSFVTYMKKVLVLNRDESYCWMTYQMVYEVYLPEFQLLEQNIPFGKGDLVQVKISPSECEKLKKDWE